MSAEEFEPVLGLPEQLPRGERMLWQGSPDWRSLAARAFQWRAIVAYFAILAGVRLVSGLMDGETATTMLGAVLFIIPIVAVGVGLMMLLAFLTARSTIYTITDRRIVLRIGVALSVTFNIPFGSIETVDVKRHRDGTGDIALGLAAGQRIAYLVLWPHVRPWRLARPEPMLRGLKRPDAVAQVLAGALAGDGPAIASRFVDAAHGARAAAAGQPAHAALAS